MIFELLGAFAAGLAAAGVALALTKSSRGRVPRAAAPISAGAAMLAFAIWSEQSWYERTRATLPPGLVVIEPVARSSWWRPWSWAFPRVERFAALDRAGALRNPAAPELSLVGVYLFERWRAPERVDQVVDCATGRRADLDRGARFDAEGVPSGLAWAPIDERWRSAFCARET